MKKLLLLLSFSLFTVALFAQSDQTQKPATLAEQTKMYPVPAKSDGPLNVLFDQPVTVKSVYLVRSDGWMPGAWLSPQSGQKIVLQLPKLSSGPYLLRFSLADGSFFSKKFIVYR